MITKTERKWTVQVESRIGAPNWVFTFQVTMEFDGTQQVVGKWVCPTIGSGLLCWNDCGLTWSSYLQAYNACFKAAAAFVDMIESDMEQSHPRLGSLGGDDVIPDQTPKPGNV